MAKQKSELFDAIIKTIKAPTPKEDEKDPIGVPPPEGLEGTISPVTKKKDKNGK